MFIHTLISKTLTHTQQGMLGGGGKDRAYYRTTSPNCSSLRSVVGQIFAISYRSDPMADVHHPCLAVHCIPAYAVLQNKLNTHSSPSTLLNRVLIPLCPSNMHSKTVVVVGHIDFNPSSSSAILGTSRTTLAGYSIPTHHVPSRPVLPLFYKKRT